MTGPAPAIAVHGVVKRYGGRAVLDDVTFEVAPGELFALLGPNGAGKTTTVEIVEGYRRADGGAVAVLGADPARGGPAHRARIGLMLQDGGMEPRARPAEILRLFASFHDAPRDVDELIDLVGLRSVARTRYRQLSGGERQRLALAVALVGRPELLVLDEPTAGMDPAARASTREVISGLRANAVTILLTTHDLVDVERLADHVAILNRGRLVAWGTPAELAAAGVPRLTLRFGRPLAEGDLASLATTLAEGWKGIAITAIEGDATRLLIETAPDPALLLAVATWASGRGLLVTELQALGRTLEDRYLELTRDAAVAATKDVA